MLSKVFPEVRASEKHRFLYFLLLAALLLAGQAVGLTVSESLLLSRLGVDALPQAIFAASITTVIGSALYTAWVGRSRSDRSFVTLLSLGVAFLLLAYLLVKAQVGWIFVGLFCFYCLTFTVFYTHFYSLASEYFDTLAAKRLLPLLGVGATLGEIVGGFSASFLSRLLTAEQLLFLWAGFLALTAALLRLTRKILESWNPESSSVKTTKKGGLKAGFAYLRRSRLGRSLAFTVATMILAMSMVQYIYSDVFVSHFPEEQELAAFLGAFLGVTNLFELLISARLTPWLIRKLGVAQTNLIHPLGAVLTLVLVKLDYALIPAMLAWMNRKMIQDSLASPVRALLFNAFPARFRGPVRGFLDGVVGSSASALAGLVLLVLQGRFSVHAIVWFGIGVSALYLLGAWLVRSAYLETLLASLSEGRLQLGSATLKGMTEYMSSVGEDEMLRVGLNHEQAEVRRLCVEALGERTPASVLTDPHPEVKFAAATALRARPESLRVLLEDPEPEFRLMARVAVGERTVLNDLARQLHHSDEREALAALNALAFSHDPLARVLMARALADPRARLRGRVAVLVARRGAQVLPQLQPYFRSAVEATAGAAYEAAARTECAEGRLLLAHELRVLVREAWGCLHLSQALVEVSEPEERSAEFLVWALQEQAERCQRLSLRLLGLMEGESVVNPVVSTLRFAGTSRRANAMEVLSNLGDRDAAGLLVLLLEDSPLPERLKAAARLEPRLGQAPADINELLELCGQFPSRFVRLGVAAWGQPLPRRLARLLRLRGFELFASLSLEELSEVDGHLVEERFKEGQSVVKVGQACDRFYFLLEGELDTPGAFFGEVPALDGAPATVTVTTKASSRLWSLEAETLKELVRSYPSIGLAIIRKLVNEVRLVETDLHLAMDDTKVYGGQVKS